jgi:hypothetical protein
MDDKFLSRKQLRKKKRLEKKKKEINILEIEQ